MQRYAFLGSKLCFHALGLDYAMLAHIFVTKAGVNDTTGPTDMQNSIYDHVPANGNISKKINKIQNRAARFWLEMLWLCLVALAVPGVVYLDAVVLFDNMSEQSVTEALQSVLLVLSASLFAMGARRQPHAAGYLGLMTTLFVIMLVRENDGHLDHIRQGFWIFPALAIAAYGAYWVWQRREALRTPFLNHSASGRGMFVFFGFVFLVIFSRAFGSGDLWRAIMQENYSWQFKAAVQEGLELMGYAIIAYGSIGSYLTRFGQDDINR